MKDEMATNKPHMGRILTGTWSTEIQTGPYDPPPPHLPPEREGLCKGYDFSSLCPVQRIKAESNGLR